MNVIGIDLSGPRNIADTYLVVLEERGAELHWIHDKEGANDQDIFHTVSDLGKNERIVIGMDAPLSYITLVEEIAPLTGNCVNWFQKGEASGSCRRP